MIKNICAVVGGLTIVFAIAGSVGIGQFTYIYSPSKYICAKEPT